MILVIIYVCDIIVYLHNGYWSRFTTNRYLNSYAVIGDLINPIINGSNQLPNPAIIIGISTKQLVYNKCDFTFHRT